MRGAPESHGQGALAGDGVGGDVAEVVDHQQGGGQQPDRHRRQQGQAR